MQVHATFATLDNNLTFAVVQVSSSVARSSSKTNAADGMPATLKNHLAVSDRIRGVLCHHVLIPERFEFYI